MQCRGQVFQAVAGISLLINLLFISQYGVNIQIFLPLTTSQESKYLEPPQATKGKHIDTQIVNCSTLKDWTKSFIYLFEGYSKEEYRCKNLAKRGKYKLDCNTYPFIMQKPCLVYSFGINYQWSFDDSMAALGCEVFAFDPSMFDTPEHKRNTGVHFYPIGIGTKSTDNFAPRLDNYTKRHPDQKWKIRTLKDLMKDLGHEKRKLDLLKIDVEAYEWDIATNIIEDKLVPQIKQMNMEFHIFTDMGTSRIQYFVEVYHSIKQAGFQQIKCSILSSSLQPIRLVAECAFVNSMFA